MADAGQSAGSRAARNTLPLYRAEAVANRRGLLPGEGSAVPPPGQWLVAGAAIVVVAMLAALLCFGRYTASDTVRGYVTAGNGTLRVPAPRPGIIDRVAVREGQAVRRGDLLFTVTTARDTTGGSVDAAAIAALEAQVAAARGRLERAGAHAANERRRLERAIDAGEHRATNLANEVRLAARALALADAEIERRAELADRGLVAGTALSALEAGRVDAALRQAALVRDLADTRARLAASRAVLAALPLELADRRDALQAALQDASLRLAEARGQAGYAVPAPAAGRVSGLTAQPGQAVGGHRAVLTLVPAAGRFRVVLLVPTRAAGFIAAGDAVRVRVDAFPHQKFGALPGRVVAVSAAPLAPADLPVPAAFAEPGYLVDVEFAANAVSPRLQAGMSVAADVLRDRRRLVEWLFAPALGALQRLE